MSMLAKIQAAKANLDADTARRPPKVQPQTAEFNQHQNGSGNNGIAGGDAAATATRSRSFHFGSGSDSAATPAPPIGTLTFSARGGGGGGGTSHRAASDLSSGAANPYANVGRTSDGGNDQQQYVRPEYSYAADGAGGGDDNDTITSSLSGTLPDVGSAPRRGGAALTRDHLLASLAAGAVAAANGGVGYPDAASPRLGSGPAGGIGAMGSSSHNNSANSANSGGSRNKASANGDATKRIEEIMSAYQDKVDTILKKRDGEGSGSVRSGTSRSSGNYRTIVASPVGQSSSSVGGGASSRTDDILSTYKQRVGEIMGQSKSVDGMSPVVPPVSPPIMAVGNTILDDEDSDGRETAVDDGGPYSDDETDDEEEDGEGEEGGSYMSGRSTRSGSMSQSHGSRSHDSRSHGSYHSRRSYASGRSGSYHTRDSYASEHSYRSQNNSYLSEERSRNSYRSEGGGRSPGPDDHSDHSEHSDDDGEGSYMSREEDSRERSSHLVLEGSSPPPRNRPVPQSIGGGAKGGGSMSQRANAILASLGTPSGTELQVREEMTQSEMIMEEIGLGAGSDDDDDDDRSHRSDEYSREEEDLSRGSGESPGDGGSGGGSHHDDEDRTHDDDDDDDDDDSYISGGSYISGASSASELSQQIEGARYGYHTGLPPDRTPADGGGEGDGEDDEEDERRDTFPPDGAGGPPSSAGVDPATGYKRKDSLTRAQELTSLRPPSKALATQSFHAGENQTKGSLISDVESERKYRTELERRLAETSQREAELANENARLERSLADVRGQFDRAAAEARSGRYSGSEQASRIKDMERKLKVERERYEELERERDTMKEEYDQDLEEQKDINRQLEQMVMSEEFEKELEDEINQVKELEHANRRFKVKIDMLEREKNTISKKYETRIEEHASKNSALETQLKEWEDRAKDVESENRRALEKLEGSLEEEKRAARDLRFDLDKAESKMKSMESELSELRESSGRIDEYEQVLGKLMERNEELESEVKSSKSDLEIANRQLELADRRRTLKTKDLEEKVEEQRIMIEQQQETLDESVKTILKLYSLNNERGDDLSVLSEDKLGEMARAMVPRLSSGVGPAGRYGADRGGDRCLASSQHPDESDAKPPPPAGAYGGRSRRESAAATANRTLNEDVDALMQERESQLRARSRGRPRLGAVEGGEEDVGNNPAGRTDVAPPSDRLRARSRGRGRLGDDVESEISQIRARSRGRPRPPGDDLDDGISNKPPPRAKSRGRGERTESIRALTERARTPARGDRSRSPHSGSDGDYMRRRSSDQYDPSGPMSDSRALVMASAEPANADSLALVPVEPRKEGYGGYDVPPPMSSSRSRRDVGGDRSAYGGDRSAYGGDRDRGYSDRPARYDKSQSSGGGRSLREGGSRNHPSSSGGGYRGDRGGHGEPRIRSEREHRSSRDHRDRYDRGGGGGGVDDPYYRGDRDRDSRGGGGYPPRERERRGGGGGSRPPPYDEYRSSSGRPSQSQGRDPSVAGDASYGGGGGHRHRDRRHSRRQREVMDP